jgi:Raf kinase inhibitor-like YbhB/YbcL family protein
MSRPSLLLAVALSLALGACAGAQDKKGDKGTGGAGGEAGEGGGSGGGEGGGGGASGGQSGRGGSGATGGSGGSDIAADAGTSTMPDAGGAPSLDTSAREPDVASPSGDGPPTGGAFTLTSSVFKEGGVIPTQYRCKYENVSPPLSWTAGPKGTQSYAMVMIHTTSFHWVLWDIPLGTTSLPMGVERMPQPPVPAGSKQDKPNIDGATWYGYTGPCPATSSHYEYIVYALDVATLPGVTPETATKQVNAAIQAHKLASAQLSGTASAR